MPRGSTGSPRGAERKVRILAHLLKSPATLRRHFPSHALTAIEEAIDASETKHRAEIRVAIEVALDLKALWRARTARRRALEVFAELGLAETRERNGVLIYVLLAERDAEIVADGGCERRVTESEWQRVCTVMEREFAADRWRDGILAGIELATALLAREFPPAGPGVDEQQNRPAVF